MESPSPQLVGQEFVRQYYTLLHERPKYLHRFYSNNSSFIHGGIVDGGHAQEPAVGQSEIHKRIMALNFNECHTKIRQVDSQATVAGAVVVQVTGELSNNGAPMRRFMQTFVLAPQSPNKYYVHNDIFRYQDEVFIDDSDSGDDELPSPPDVQVARTAVGSAAPSEPLVHTLRIDDEAQHHSAAGAATATSAQQPPVVTGTDSGQYVVDLRSVEHAAVGVSKKDDAVSTSVDLSRTASHVAAPAAHAEAKQPKTWSNVIQAPKATGASSGATGARNVSEQLSTAGSAYPLVSSQESTVKIQEAESSVGSHEHTDHGLPAPAARSTPNSGVDATADGGTGSQDVRPASEGSRPKPPFYPDSQQVFVGNLPSGTTDDDVRAMFSDAEVAEIVSIKVNTSPNSRVPYAFVVFSSDTLAHRALEKKDYCCKGQNVNVEEKRTRTYPRGGMMGRYNNYYHQRGSSSHYYTRGGGGGVGRMGPSTGSGRRGGGGGQQPTAST